MNILNLENIFPTFENRNFQHMGRFESRKLQSLNLYGKAINQTNLLQNPGSKYFQWNLKLRTKMCLYPTM